MFCFQTVFFDEYNEDLGLQFSLTAFDCEQNLTLDDLIENNLFISLEKCGIVLAIVNEHQSVTKLEFSFDHDFYSLMNNPSLFLNENIKLNYSVKNKDNFFKSWDFSYKSNNDIHNRSECEINAISKKEAVIDRTVNCNFSKIYNHDDVQRTWKIISNDIIDGKPSESTKVSIENTEINNEFNSIINLKEIIEKCDTIKDKFFIECFEDMSELVLSEYNISHSNLKPEQLLFLTKISDLFKSKYTDNFKRIYKYIHENDNMTVRITRPINRDGVNILVKTPHQPYEYKKMTINSIISPFFLQPHSEFEYNDDKINNIEVEISNAEKEKGVMKKIIYKDGWMDLMSTKYILNNLGICSWSFKIKENETSDDLVSEFHVSSYDRFESFVI